MSVTQRNRDHDNIRLLAASIVVIAHIRAFFFMPFAQLKDSNFITEVFYFSTSLGHQAVVIFFVLSGYYVGGPLLNLKKLNFRIFIAARLSRLWIVLIPVLFLTLVLIYPICFVNPEKCRNLNLPSLSSSVSTTLGLDTLIGNAFFLQGFRSKIYGSNAPLWSLSYEFWFYVFAFLLIWVIVNERKILSFVLVMALILLSYFLNFGFNWFIWFFTWWLGALSSKISLNLKFNFLPRVLNGVSVTIILLVTIKSLSFNRFEPSHSIMTDLLLGVLFSFYLNASKPKEINKVSNRKILSDFSYSLYALHFILLLSIYFAVSEMGSSLPLQLSWMSIAAFFLLFSFIFFVSFLFSLITERHTPWLRSMLQKPLR